MSDATAALLAAPPTTLQPRRDYQGRYVIPDPITGNDRSWTRATTVAKTLDDTYHLSRYLQRMVAHGVGVRRDLYALAAATPVDDKRSLDDLCEQARAAAGDGAKANIGTALHSFTQRYDEGESEESIDAPAPWCHDLNAYVTKLAECDVKVVEGMVERIVTLHEFGIAGTFDRLVALPDRRLPLIADLKTGDFLNWQAFAIQFATYAYADTYFDLKTQRHEPMPDVDKTRALVIHLPAGEARCDLYLIDIEVGWEALQRAVWVREFRTLKTIDQPWPEAIETTASDADASNVTAAPPVEPTPEQVAALRARVGVILAHSDEAKAAIAQAWPAGVPTFKAGGQTLADLEAIGAACADVEREHCVAFPEVEAVFEYVAADDPRVLGIETRVAALPSDLAAVVAAGVLDAQIPKLTSGRATPADVRAVADLVDAVEADALEREAEVVGLLGPWVEDVDTVDAIFATIEADDATVGTLNADDVSKVDALTQAIDLCLVGLSYEGETPTLMSTEQAEAYIVSRYGTKAAALAAAKDVATALGKSKPRSVSVAAADPLIAAHVATLPLPS